MTMLMNEFPDDQQQSNGDDTGSENPVDDGQVMNGVGMPMQMDDRNDQQDDVDVSRS